jgi:hypothetical protein
MLLAVGTKVVLVHSKDEAVVTELLEDGMVKVRLLESGLEIPIFAEDVKRLSKQSEKEPRAKIVPGKQEKHPKAPSRQPAESQYTILKRFGIQLAFAPVQEFDMPVEKYEIYLINDTPHPVLFTFALSLEGRKAIQQNGKLEGESSFLIGELLRDQLNDSPSCAIESWRIMTDGSGSRMAKQLKIKPKQFFKKLMTAPLLNRPAHLYRIFEKLATRDDKAAKNEDLKTYTKRAQAPKVSNWLDIGDRFSQNVMDFASFVPEIDLHIDKLVPNYKKLDKKTIVRIQLQHFEEYIEKAIQLGVERVFIIHGVGEGKLRNQIASRLIQMPEVVTFKNEYHPRYGYGATEVIF